MLLLEDYKSYNGLTSPKSDEKLQYVISFVNKYIERYCGTSFEPTAVVGHKITSENGTEILIPHAPLISVEELKVSGEVEPAEDYIVHKDIGVVESYSTFPTTRYSLEVSYTYGYDGFPYDLLLAAIELVDYYDSGNFSKSFSVKGETVDMGQTELIPAHIRAILSTYKVL